MTSNWDSYLTTLDGSRASIFLDLGLRPELPLETKSWLLFIFLQLKSPREDGLSSTEEMPTLIAIEDSLTDEIRKSNQGVVSGSITTLARREFYFYGETEVGFEDAVVRAMKAYPGYFFMTFSQSDPEWRHYLDVLYPSPKQMELMANLKLLDRLEAAGDIFSIPRKVVHWIYFATAQERAAFEAEVAAANFDIDSVYLVDGEFPFATAVSRTQSIERAEIDATTLQLFDLANRFEGDYAGWETPVTTE